MRTRTVAVVALAALAVAAPAASAHQGNPNFLSQVDAITPATQGVTVDVLNRDDRFLLHNTSGEDVVIEGYDEEPYARVLADGTVQVNTNSEAYYLNDDRYANAKVPKGADGRHAGLEGDRQDRPVRVARPPDALDVDDDARRRCTDKDARTKIFDWPVPIEDRREAGRDRGDAVLDAAARRRPAARRDLHRRRDRRSRSASSSRSCATGAAATAERPAATRREAW